MGQLIAFLIISSRLGCMQFSANCFANRQKLAFDQTTFSTSLIDDSGYHHKQLLAYDQLTACEIVEMLHVTPHQLIKSAEIETSI